MSSADFIPWDEATRLGDLPRLAAERWSDRECLVYGGQGQSFAQLAEKVDDVARGLMALGVEPGERVAIWLTNCPQWVYLMFAIAKIGAVHVPMNTRLRTQDARYILAQAGCSTLITHDVSGPVDYWSMVNELVPERDRSEGHRIKSSGFPNLRRIIIMPSQSGHPVPGGVHSWQDVADPTAAISTHALEQRAAAVRPTDPLFIMYTSGTTGFPKGVVRHHGLLRNHLDRAKILDLRQDDVIFNYLPLFHVFGYVDGPLSSMLAGIRHILVANFDPDECLDAIEREGVSLLFGFETHFKLLCDAQERQPRDLSSLRTGICACGMKSAEPVALRVLELLAPIRPLTAYDMTEIGANICLSQLGSNVEQFSQTSGLPCDGFDIRIIDPATGLEQPTGTAGEIIIKSYNLMLGYFGKPEETAAAYDEDGFFHTGDMGYLRPDGYMRFVGRYKDMLKIGGENVDPMEVEKFLIGHPDIHEVAVVGHADRKLTEVAVAFVIRETDSDVSETEIITACKGKIASFKVPRHVIFVSELPMTSSGKVQKVKLREQAFELLSEEGA